MRVVITANGRDLDAAASSVFGRCPWLLFVDTETLACDAVENPAQAARGGAGIQAAQFIVSQGAQALLSANVGPNAFDVLRAAHIPVYQIGEGSVRSAVAALRANQLPVVEAANAHSHSGQGHHRA
jgi:predicted Fe-Mo cluster-binding NifX family protein